MKGLAVKKVVFLQKTNVHNAISISIKDKSCHFNRYFIENIQSMGMLKEYYGGKIIISNKIKFAKKLTINPKNKSVSNNKSRL